MNVPAFIRKEPRGLDDTRLRALEQEISLPPRVPMAPDPLSPRAAELVNQAMIAAAQKLGEEFVASTKLRLEEAQADHDSAVRWAEEHLATVTKIAHDAAALHHRQRACSEAFAAAQAVYEGIAPEIESLEPEAGPPPANDEAAQTQAA